MAVRARQEMLVDDEVRPRRMTLSVVAWNSARRGAGRDEHQADQQRHQQCGERRPDEVRGPATPADERPDEAGRHAADGRPEQEVGVLVATQDQQRIVEGPREGRADQHDQADREPAVDPAQRPEQIPRCGRS